MCQPRSNEDYLRLRVLLLVQEVSDEAKSPLPPINIGISDKCRIAIAEIDFSKPISDVTADKCEDPVVAKLDAVMEAVRQLETRVTKRLDNIERVLLENTNRITRIEQLLPPIT